MIRQKWLANVGKGDIFLIADQCKPNKCCSKVKTQNPLKVLENSSSHWSILSITQRFLSDVIWRLQKGVHASKTQKPLKNIIPDAYAFINDFDKTN